MGLLFLNSLKGLKKKKVQMLGIILMVLLSTGIYVCMNLALDRLENRYYDYLEEQKVEHFSIDVVLDYEKDISVSKIDDILNQYPFTDEEKVILEQYKTYLSTSNREYNLPLLNQVSLIFGKYEVDLSLKNSKLDPLADKYDFDYDIERSKTVTQNKVMMKVIPYRLDKKMNVPYLVDGRFPKNDDEITVLPRFAEVNNLKIGDTYKIGSREYKIVGTSYAPDYIYPLISFSMPIFDEKKNNIVFMTMNSYEEIAGVEEKSYSLYYNHPISRDFANLLTNENSEESKMFAAEKDTLTMSMDSVTRVARIGALQMDFSTDRKFADCFLYLLLGVSVLIIMIITKKRIDDERLQIGVLKSLGYSRFSIAFSYLVYPIVGSLIGGILGYLIGVLLHQPLSLLYRSYYTIPLASFNFDPKYFTTSVFVPMCLLSLLSYIIAFTMLRKKPLALLREGSNLKVNFLSRLVNKITSLFSFESRFKYALASRSVGKLLIVTITSFCTGLLIVLVLIGANLFQSLIDKSFSGMKYDYMVNTRQIAFSNSSQTDDYAFSLSMNVSEVKDASLKTKEIDLKDFTVSLTGVDTETNYIDIYDDKEKTMLPLLTDQEGIIINQNVSEVKGIEIGDTILFDFQGTKIEYHVIGISQEFMGMSGYVNREELSKKLGFTESAYNQIYTKDTKYGNIEELGEEQGNIAFVLSLKDLKDNIQKQMDSFDASISIVIFFAAFMAFIIIAVIANIVVEENKKTISLMKVIGYQNRFISKIVLNIYTPFIIIAYLLSIPTMISILKWIVSLLTGDMNMVIPITLSMWKAGLGLIGLLVAYYIAIALSKRVLNKVPLSIALKRE